jgi:hypothetical protein
VDIQKWREITNPREIFFLVEEFEKLHYEKYLLTEGEGLKEREVQAIYQGQNSLGALPLFHFEAHFLSGRLYCSLREEAFHLKKDELVQLYLPEKRIFLEARVERVAKRKVGLSLPFKAHVEEKRQGARLAEFSDPLVANLTKKRKEEHPVRLNPEVLDFSSQGIAVRVPLEDFHSYYEGDNLTLTSIDGLEGGYEAMGKIVYLKREGELGREYYRAGIQFLQPIPSYQKSNYELSPQ